MASVKSPNKETLGCENNVKGGLGEDLKKLNLKKGETCMAKEGGKMKQRPPHRKANYTEQEKMTGKEVVASKELKDEAGPEEFLKHPLQVTFDFDHSEYDC